MSFSLVDHRLQDSTNEKSLNAFVHQTLLRPQPPHTGRSDDLHPPGPGHEAGVEDGGGQQPRCGPHPEAEAGQAGSGHTGHTGQPLWALRGQHQAGDGGHQWSGLCGNVNICENKILHHNSKSISTLHMRHDTFSSRYQQQLWSGQRRLPEEPEGADKPEILGRSGPQ